MESQPSKLWGPYLGAAKPGEDSNSLTCEAVSSWRALRSNFLAVRKQLGFTPQGLGLLVPLLFKGYFLCFMDATPATGNLNLEPVKSGCPD
jgi:hypothetical protein